MRKDDAADFMKKIKLNVTTDEKSRPKDILHRVVEDSNTSKKLDQILKGTSSKRQNIAAEKPMDIVHRVLEKPPVQGMVVPKTTLASHENLRP